MVRPSSTTKPSDGSSIINNVGFDMSARAMASCWASLPDRNPAGVVHLERNTGNWSAISLSSAERSPAATVTPPILRFSSTVRSTKIRRCSGTSARPDRNSFSGGELVISAPSNVMVPAAGVSNPAIELSNVVLPAPLGPMRPTTSPDPTVRWASRSAEIAPYLVVNPDTSSTAIWAPTVGLGDVCRT